jgi:hypothetical protein
MRDREREREREQEAGPVALIVDGRELHVFMKTPPDWVVELTRLKGIQLRPLGCAEQVRQERKEESP